MERPAGAFGRAERRIRDAERNLAHQMAILDELVRDGHERAAEVARGMLATLERSLELTHEHLRLEHPARGIGPEDD
jgi:hypothetical protein